MLGLRWRAEPQILRLPFTAFRSLRMTESITYELVKREQRCTETACEQESRSAMNASCH